VAAAGTVAGGAGGVAAAAAALAGVAAGIAVPTRSCLAEEDNERPTAAEAAVRQYAEEGAGTPWLGLASFAELKAAAGSFCLDRESPLEAEVGRTESCLLVVRLAKGKTESGAPEVSWAWDRTAFGEREAKLVAEAHIAAELDAATLLGLMLRGGEDKRSFG
jgi:hypothetical protein